jgi:ribosomal-protein-alanine N-acetyltransferase
MAFRQRFVATHMSLQPPRSFETARLTACVPSLDDADEAFAAYASDLRVTRYLSWKAYIEAEPLRLFFSDRRRDWDEGGDHLAWLLRLKATGRIIGSIGAEMQRHAVCFGYVMAHDHWGKGLTAEALNYLTHWALAQPAIYRAWAFCDVENEPSARVMEKCGFEREGRLRRWHVCPTIGPEPRDCIVLAKTR